jgi:hypothetical protein
MENLPRLGMALVLLYGGYLAIDGQVTVGTIVTFNAYVLLLQAPFRMLGFFMMHEPAGRGVGRAHLRDPRHAGRDHRPARRRRPRRPRGRGRAST